MTTIFPPFDPFDDKPEPGRNRKRFERIRNLPLLVVIPNMITLLALCSGLTAIRMTIEGRYDLAIAAVVVAAVLDGLDGRIARFLKSTSRFGAELDSLTDFVNFGVAPAIMLYGWILHEARSIGWLAALVFAIAAALRLARFNVMLLSADRPAWQANFFTGVPAPAGAITVLLPLYVAQLGISIPDGFAVVIAAYVVLIAVLMVSRVPTYSGKKMGHIRRDLVLPLFVLVVLLAGLFLSFPFEMLVFVSSIYLICLPLGWRAWNRLARAHGEPEQEVVFVDETAAGGAEKSG